MKIQICLVVAALMLAGCNESPEFKQLAADAKRGADAAEKSAATLAEIKTMISSIKQPDLTKIEASLATLGRKSHAPFAVPFEIPIEPEKVGEWCQQLGYTYGESRYVNVGRYQVFCLDK